MDPEQNRRQELVRQLAQQSQYLTELCGSIFDNLNKCKICVFQQLEKPFRAFSRTHCAGSIVPATCILTKSGDIKEIAEITKNVPVQIEEETLHYKELKDKYLLLENPMNKWCTRAIVFPTSQYMVMLAFFKSTSFLNLDEEYATAVKLLKDSSLDEIQLTDKPKPIRPVSLVYYDDDGVMVRKQKFPWALRCDKYQEGRETVLFKISAHLRDFAWRVQEVVQLMQKFENVYFLCTIPEMTPDTYRVMAQENYFLGLVNALWYISEGRESRDEMEMTGGRPSSGEGRGFEWIYFNARGQENCAGDDTDELYNALCDKYFEQGEPDVVQADVIFFQLDPRTVVYSGLRKEVVLLQEEETRQEKKEEDQETREQPRQRKPRQSALVADPNIPEKDDDEEDDMLKDMNSEHDNLAEDEQPEEEAEQEPQIAMNTTVLFVSPKFKYFKQLLLEYAQDCERFRHVTPYLCIQTSSQLNMAQFATKFPCIHKLRLLLDDDGFFAKVAAQGPVFMQMFDKNNKLLIETTIYDELLEVILKKETKKLRAAREKYEKENPLTDFRTNSQINNRSGTLPANGSVKSPEQQNLALSGGEKTAQKRKEIIPSDDSEEFDDQPAAPMKRQEGGGKATVSSDISLDEEQGDVAHEQKKKKKRRAAKQQE